MGEQLVVVGAGGFGREVIDVIDAVNSNASQTVFEVLGVVDDGPTQLNLDLLAARGITFLGDVDGLLATVSKTRYVVGVGSPSARSVVASKFDAAGWHAATVVHPDVTVGYGVEIGVGSVVCAGVRLTTNIRLGRHVHLNLNTTVGHDTTLGNFVSTNPLASISGDCVIEDGVLIGVGAVILNGLTVGAASTVGGAACVVRDVPPGATVKGVPAR